MGIAKHTYKRNRRGFTLIELVIVMGVIGSVTAALWIAYANVRISSQVRTAAQQLVSIVQNTRASFAEQGGVIGAANSGLTASLDQMKIFPTEMRDPAACPGGQPYGCIFNPWATTTFAAGGFTFGTVQVAADNCNGVETAATPQPCFGVTYFRVPYAACLKLVMETSDFGMQLTRVLVGAGGPLVPPVTAVATRTACSNANVNNTVQITWTYVLRATQ